MLKFVKKGLGELTGLLLFGLTPSHRGKSARKHLRQTCCAEGGRLRETCCAEGREAGVGDGSGGGLFEVDDSDSCTSVADIFVGEGGDVGIGIKEVTNQGPENSLTGAVKDASSGSTELDSIVDEMSNLVECLISPHSSDVYFTFKFKLTFSAMLNGTIGKQII